MAKHLEPGDVFFADKRMIVNYGRYPCCLYKSESIFSTRTTEGHIHINELRQNRTDASKERSRIASAIEDIFKKEGAPLDLDILHRFVKHQVRDPEPKSLMIPEGYYIVTKLEIGQHGRDRKLYCKTYKPTEANPETCFYFYQDSNNLETCSWVVSVDVTTLSETGQ